MDAVGAKNQAIYDDLWAHYTLFPHDGWAAWQEISPHYSPGRTLEIGPGMFPHVPIPGTHFADLSRAALHALRDAGGLCVRATTPLPYPDGSFDLVCMFEVLEHVEADEALLDEVARVLAPGGRLYFSCPMNPAYWTYYDEVMGHVRRYRPDELSQKLSHHGFDLVRVCARHDRMDRWFGALFGFGTKHLGSLTARIVQHYLPKVAAMPWPWHDGGKLDEANTKGGIIAKDALMVLELRRQSMSEGGRAL
jgi:SAM-dependent methyltransferase